MTEQPILNNERESNGESKQKLVKIAQENDAGSSSIGSSSFRSVLRNRFSFDGIVDPTRAVHCKDLTGHSSVIRAIEFSDDGSLFASGGDGDRPVLVWRMDQVLNGTRSAVPFVLKIQNNFQVFCLAISPDNSRIFVSGRPENMGEDILVFDAQTQVKIYHRGS